MAMAIFTKMTSFSANAQPVPAVTSDFNFNPLGFFPPASVTHLSCDGYTDRSGLNKISAFAWDGPSEAWGSDYNIYSPSTLYSYAASGVEHPEIAIVSNLNTVNRDIYAVVVYNVPGTGALYEIHQWDNSTNSFFTAIAYSGTLSSTSVNNRVINVAGDEYGHFAMICDDGVATTTISQLTGYILPATGAIIMGSVGTITYNPPASGFTFPLSNPDIDLTYTNKGAFKDASVHMVFIADILGNPNVVSAATTSFNLSPGGVHDITSEVTSTQATCNARQEPTIAVNDGFIAIANGFIAHAGVTYMENCGGKDVIYIYPVTEVPNFIVFPLIVNSTTNIANVSNKHPIIATKPAAEEASMIAWDLADPTNVFGPNFNSSGFAHNSSYDNPTNVYNPAASPDMQVNYSLPGNTSLCTVSGLGPDRALLFYYDNVLNTLNFKQPLYYSSALKVGKDVQSKISIAPNPVHDRINIISDKEFLSGQLFDITGRKILSLVGDKNAIQSSLNNQINGLLNGMYCLKIQLVNGDEKILRFIKD